MAEQAVSVREHPEFVRLLKTHLGRASGRVFTYRYPRKDEGAEISLIHNHEKRMQIKIWTSFNQVGSRPEEDRYIHFLLIDRINDPLHKHLPTSLWHCQRIKYDGANPTQTILTVIERVAGLLELARSRVFCNSPLCVARTLPLYVKPADQIAWFCPIADHHFYHYVHPDRSKLIIAQTDPAYMAQASTPDPEHPMFKKPPTVKRTRQKQPLQTAFSFQS